jgi:opacity protein-like surface antigen
MILLFGVVLAVVLSSGAQAADATAPGSDKQMQTDKADSGVQWGHEVGGLESRIWTDKERFNTEEAVPVHYAIRNVAKEPKTVWHSGFSANHRIDVTGPDGKPAKFVGGGESATGPFTPQSTREKNAPFVLSPGGIDDAYVVYNLRDYFDMGTPGTYLVQYLYQDKAEDKPVLSNELRVVVEKAAK